MNDVLIVNQEPMVLLDVPEGTQEFATTDGQYFVRCDAFVDSVHLLLHDVVLPLAEVNGRDTEAYANAGHALVNLMWESLDALVMEISLALPAADDHAEPSADPED